MNKQNTKTQPARKGFSFWGFLKIVLLIVLILLGLGAFWFYYNFYASPIPLTTLNKKEQQVLDSKLVRLSSDNTPEETAEPQSEDGQAVPEPYSEKNAKREISLSEKELNSMLSKDPEFSKRVAIDLAPDLVSLTALIPVDEDIIVLGGKTIRLKLGVKLKSGPKGLVVALQGVSVGGVPIPNAWLGDLKHKNLVQEFSGEGGFWDSFSAGIESVSIVEGSIKVKLKE